MKSKQPFLKALLTFSILVLAFGCDMSSPSPKNAKSGAPAIDPDMAEAVFRYQFEHNGSGLQTDAAAYFLEIGGADPDDAFMHRFQDHHPLVKKRSQCSTEGVPVTDKETGEWGLIFRIEEIVVTGVDTAEASGGYYEAGLSASGNTYYLKRKNGKWFVEKETRHWVSQRSPNKRIDLYVSNRAASRHSLKRRSC